MPSTLFVGAILAPLVGCRGCSPEVCPTPAEATPQVGDVNADGHVDLSDGIYLQRYALAGGPAPVCPGAWDWVRGVGRPETPVAANIWSFLFDGRVQALPSIAEGTCDEPVPPEVPECGAMELTLDTPGRVDASSFEVHVLLESRTLAVDGWSLSVTTEGCSIASATTAGTVGSDAWSGGLRREGFDATATTSDGGAVSAVVLSWLERVQVPAGDEARRILSLRVDEDPPEDGCTTCLVRLEDGRTGGGQPVRNVISHEGWSYVPDLPEVEVEVCAP